MKPRFLADRLGIMGFVEGREREGLTIFEVCCGIPIRRNSILEGLSDSGLKVFYGRREIFRNKAYEELCVVSI